MHKKALKKTLAAAVTVLLFSGLAASAAVAQTRVTMFEAEEIVGEVQLPSVQIFVTRQNLNSDYDLELEESFVPKIIESVEKRPF
ncbi:MAG: hypothetical protein ACI9VR_001882 [Cognaticolwellia sp.]|jgi:hypothetical protein